MSAKPENERERIARIIKAACDQSVRSFSAKHPTNSRHILANEAADAIIAQRETGEPVGWTGSGSLAQLSPGRDGVGYIWPTKDLSHPIALYLVPPPPTEAHARVDTDPELFARVKELADLEAKFIAARNAMNAAVPAFDAPTEARQAHTLLYHLDNEASRAVFSAARRFAADAAALLSGSTPKPARVEPNTIADGNVREFLLNWFAPWGSWKTAWWEGEVSDDVPMTDANALKHVHKLLTAALTGASAKEGEG